MWEAWDHAMLELLQHPDDYRSSAGVQLELRWHDGAWHVVPNAKLLQLLTGGIDVDGMSKHWVPDKDTELDFDAFMSEQDESVQRLTSMRLYGMTLRNIAGQFGISFQGVNKRIKKLKKEYDKFQEEDDDE
jgi:hypothetical protein